uniref:DRY_EERY domain-containing protein n=1 Tax=Heterorhabditis bacteriophora TaxID=37862 RepID=A0A1I7WQJ5_HETBA
MEDNKNSPAMSKLKQLVLGEDSPPTMRIAHEANDGNILLRSNWNSDEPESIILDESPIEKTALGNAIDSLMVNWCQLLTNVSSRPPVPPPSTIDHVKEVAEICVKHELRDIEESINRQQTLLTRANGMWHEARRQEKLMKARIVDSSRRAERRRRFYDNVRKEPDQFMQLHGRKCIIHTDKNIAKAAEESSILRKWQGDPSILIDRFDARSHLDFIPEVKKKDFIPDRYGISTLYHSEFLRSITCYRKSMDSKASIGFTYDNSEIVVRDSDVEDSEDEGEMEEPEEIEFLFSRYFVDFNILHIISLLMCTCYVYSSSFCITADVDLDLTCVDAEAQRRANKLGEEYGVRRGTFAGLMRADQQARLETAELRRIDRQKALLAGRESKHERALLKKQRAMIVGKGCQDEATTTLLRLEAFLNSKIIVLLPYYNYSFVENANKGKKSLLDESSSSESSDEEPAKAQFITTFGGDDEKVQMKKMKKKNLKSNRCWVLNYLLKNIAGYYQGTEEGEVGLIRHAIGEVGVETEEGSKSQESNDGGDMLEIRSSMSESEKERIQIENRKRRINRTKRMVRSVLLNEPLSYG